MKILTLLVKRLVLKLKYLNIGSMTSYFYLQKVKSLKMILLIKKHHNIQGYQFEMLKLDAVLENGGRYL